MDYLIPITNSWQEKPSAESKKQLCSSKLSKGEITAAVIRCKHVKVGSSRRTFTRKRSWNQISLRRSITWPVLAQRGGSCSIVLTENMFSSSCVILPASTPLGFFFFFFFFLLLLLHRSASTCWPLKTLKCVLQELFTVQILSFSLMGCLNAHQIRKKKSKTTNQTLML